MGVRRFRCTSFVALLVLLLTGGCAHVQTDPLDRVKALAPQHPEWRTTEPFASILKGDVKAALAGGDKSLLELVAATSTGMTTTEYEAMVNDWLAWAKQPRYNQP